METNTPVTSRGRSPPTMDLVSIRSRSSSPAEPSKTLEVQVHEEDVEVEDDDQEEHQERLGPLILITRRSRSPSLPVTPPPAKCDVLRDYPYDESASDTNSDYDSFLESLTTLRSRSCHRYRTTTTGRSSDGLFPAYPYHLYDLSSRSSPSQYHSDPPDSENMFSLIHNPRTFLRFIFGIAFLMCFLTNMVSGGPLAQHLRDAFHGGHRPRPYSHHEGDLRRGGDAQSQTPPQPQGNIRVAAAPIQIDPDGVYIRASPLYDSNSGQPDTSRIIAGYAANSGTDRVLRTSLSTDSGASWSPLGEVTRLPNDGTSDLDNAMPLALPSGRILFAFRNHSLALNPSSPTGFSYTQYRLDVCSSSDGGATWSFLSHIDERPASPDPNQLNGLWEPFLRLAADGRTIQAFYSSENSRGDQDNLMRFSTDAGATWSDPPILVSSSSEADSRDGMTGVSSVSSSPCRQSELICVFETTSPSGVFSIARVLSHDDGKTWGERETVYTAKGGKWAGAPQVHLVGDALVTSFLTNEGTELEKIDGAYTKVVVSKDQGNTWTEQAQTVAGVGSHWPGLFSLNETHFLALYSTDELGAVGHLLSVSGEEGGGSEGEGN
ncbi:Sialidase [Pseudoneurospora amorphoporcata]|uniref:Sialidase n=1 Tax=Pseudoneurospora amorphoporcata TaxID=241081 RepID=A0AAN6NV00_9PEZI|nr:Sialidase [Pseudoneurospora amorphoporcata]